MARITQPPEGEPVVPDEQPVPPGTPSADEPEPETRAELEEAAAARGIHLTEGSGTGGNVVKADLVDALTDTPAPPVGRPALIDVAQAAAAHLIPTPVED
jgi:hypothetical protein